MELSRGPRVYLHGVSLRKRHGDPENTPDSPRNIGVSGVPENPEADRLETPGSKNPLRPRRRRGRRIFSPHAVFSRKPHGDPGKNHSSENFCEISECLDGVPTQFLEEITCGGLRGSPQNSQREFCGVSLSPGGRGKTLNVRWPGFCAAQPS